MIYFNSDYLEGAHPSVMARLNETNMVQTVGYGEDQYCAAAREKIRAVCQAPGGEFCSPQTPAAAKSCVTGYRRSR